MAYGRLKAEGFTSFRFDFPVDQCENNYGWYNMDVNIGDVYIRNSDGKIYKVKKIDHTMLVLESSEGSSQLALTDIYGLEKAYSKRNPS